MLLFKKKSPPTVETESKEVKNTQAKAALWKYFKIKDWKFYTNVTDVIVKESSDKFQINIICFNASLIIGKEGRTIKDISSFMRKEMNKNVQLNVTENTFWDEVK